MEGSSPAANGRYISFGTGIRLLSEDRILEDLAQSGLDTLGFRALCKALGVPCLRVGSLRYYDFFSLVIALKAALGLGKQDFWAGGGDCPPDCRDRLPNISDALPDIVAELLAARELAGRPTQLTFSEVRRGLQDAAERMRESRRGRS